jgi:uncharacterized membrane protein
MTMRRKVLGSSYTKQEPRLAAVLAYLLWIFGGMLLLTIERESRFVRFHALQSILYSAVVGGVLAATMLAGWWALSAGLGFAGGAGWLWLIYRAARGDWYQLPGLGWLAERSA